MGRRIRNIFLVISGILLTLVIAAALLASVLQDKITQKIVEAINEQVTVPVQVNGGIQLSLIRHFPYASITFKNVVIDDKLQKGKHLLKVDEFSLLCNVLSLFGGKVELSKILIQNGDVNLYRNEQGKANYDILKPSQDTAKSSLAIQLKKAEVKNLKFTMNDKAQAVLIDVDLKHLLLKGDFSSAEYDLSSDLEAVVNQLAFSGQSVAAKRTLKADIVLDVNNEKHQFTFKKGKVTVDGSEFAATGFFAMLKSGTQLDFQLSNAGKDVQKLFALFPDRYKKSFEGAEGSGEYAVMAKVKGLVSNSTFPRVDVSADLKNSEFKLGKYNKLLKKVNAQAKYQMDEKGMDRLVISNFNCTLNDLPFNFKLSLTNLSDPAFDFYANGVFHISELSTFVPDSVMSDLGGTVTFNNFHLKGQKRDFTGASNSTLTGAGDFKLNAVEFQAGGITYGNINGDLTYSDQVINAQNFTINFLTNQAVFSGNIDNLPAFAYNLSANRSANNIIMEVNGKLALKTFNLTATIDAYNKKSRPQAAARGKIDVREIMNVKGNLDISMDKFLFRKLEFDNVTCNLQIAPGMIRTNNLKAQAMDGNLQLDGKVVFGDDYSIHTNYDVKAVNLSVPKIFYQCENFGQGTLTDKHLKGTLNASVSFNMILNNYSELDQNSLSALVDFDITNGELIKFEPLRAASKYIRVDELQDIHFADLANTIKIGNRRIDIPQFEIKSSALNLMIDGYHFFNDSIDYHLKINLHKLLAQKFNRRREDIQYMEEDPYEGVNIYLTMAGYLNNPRIKYDKASQRKKIQNDFTNEKTVLKKLLNDQDQNQTNANPDKKSEERNFDIPAQQKFIEFDSTSN
jgi:hypothetical protein